MFNEDSSVKTIKFQNLSRLHATIKTELLEAFEKVLSSSAFIQGPFVTDFERSFASLTASPFCLGVANGTDALEIVLKALGIGNGQIVAVPSMTFAATAEAVVQCGAEPLFIDIDPNTLCMTESTLAEGIQKAGKKIHAVVMVHLHGRVGDIKPIQAYCNKNDLHLIEDCAQAHHASLDDHPVGTFGIAGTYSFYPGKNLGALGDAGAIITQSGPLYQKMKLARDHGRTSKYFHESVGRNSRLDGIQAAFLSVKLAHLKTWTQNRQSLAKLYDEKLQDCLQIELLQKPKQLQSHVFHNYVIRIKDGENERASLMKFLTERGIETGIHYPLGLHMQPAFTAFSSHCLPATELASKQVLSLPMDPLMSQTEVEKVCFEIYSYFRNKRA